MIDLNKLAEEIAEECAKWSYLITDPAFAPLKKRLRDSILAILARYVPVTEESRRAKWIAVTDGLPEPDVPYVTLEVRRERDFDSGALVTKHILSRRYPGQPVAEYMTHWFPLPPFPELDATQPPTTPKGSEGE